MKGELECIYVLVVIKFFLNGSNELVQYSRGSRTMKIKIRRILSAELFGFLLYCMRYDKLVVKKFSLTSPSFSTMLC